MSLFSHAVRWEFTSSNPISSGIRVGTGGKRGPSTGVRVSAKQQKEPIVLSPEQVKLGLTQLEFRDQILVLLEGALGRRPGELAALRWQDCDFENDTFQIQHSYYWRRGGHSEDDKNGSLRKTATDASVTQASSAGVEGSESSHTALGFRVPVSFVGWSESSRSCGGLKKKDSSCIREDRNHRCWLAYVPAYNWNISWRSWASIS